MMNTEYYRSLVSSIKEKITSDNYTESSAAIYTAMGMRDMVFCFDGDGSKEYEELTNIIDDYFNNGDEQ